MTNILDTTPNAEAYVFNFRFQVGHELRVAPRSELRIECEQEFEEVALFLDPHGLVPGMSDAAHELSAGVSLRSEALASGEIEVIPPVEWSEHPSRSVSGTSLSGLIASIPAGTEFGVSPSPGTHDDRGIRIRFPHDTDIEIGVSRAAPPRMRGMRPVVLDGSPLLQIADARGARVELRMRPSQTAILDLFGIVSPYRHRGESVMCHVMEAVGGRVVGGVSVRFRV